MLTSSFQRVSHGGHYLPRFHARSTKAYWTYGLQWQNFKSTHFEFILKAATLTVNRKVRGLG